MNSRQGLTILIAILLLLLMGVGYWAYKTNSEKNMLATENDGLSTELGDLKSLRDKLAVEVDSLRTAYESLANENEGLQESVEAAQKRVAEKEAVIRSIQRKSSTESGNLKTQIEELVMAKSKLQDVINNLQSENDSLRMVTGQLTADLDLSRSENQALAALNSTIQEELKRLTLANFKASAFRVEMEKNRPKATAKARRARRMLVSFDLTGVVPKYRGVRPLYLVITDDKGTPIKMSNPINATVNVNGQDMNIQAAKAQEVNIEENQRLSFNYDLEDRLNSGYYRVAVYTDIGLLGASSFRLQ